MAGISEVTVIGGGVVGLLLASRVAMLGRSVRVYERKLEPGLPVKASTILSKNGVERLGLDKKIAKNALRGAVIHVGGEKIVVKSSDTAAYVFDRHELNASLLAKAEEAGADIRLGSRIGDRFLSEIAGKTVIVGADGFPSTVAKHFSFPPIDSHLLTYRAEYGVSYDEHMVELFFDKKVTPGMFGWISPVGKTVAEVGVGVGKGFGNSKMAFQKFVMNPTVKEVVGNGKLLNEAASIIPLGRRRRIVNEREKVVLVGDAAGQVKKSTGGGIIFGSTGAIIAADVIDRFLKDECGLEEYERRWKREFGFDERMHSAIRHTYTSLSNAQLAAIAKVAKFLGIESFLSRHGDMDRPSAMLKHYFAMRGGN